MLKFRVAVAVSNQSITRSGSGDTRILPKPKLMIACIHDDFVNNSEPGAVRVVGILSMAVVWRFDTILGAERLRASTSHS